MPNEAGQIQADAKYQEGVRVVGSSSVSDGENQDLKVIQYVFECLSPEDKVFCSPLSYLSQEEFATLKAGAFLDSLVIDTFAEMLTHIERKKKITPSNWYLPVAFSEAALKGSIGHFLGFVHRQKIKENYMSDLKSCEKVFIPVHIEAKPNCGHFYLYIIHVKNEEIEIWDSLLDTCVAETDRNENTRKLVRLEDLAMKLLNSDLNQEKYNLYDKARRHYAQVEQQDESSKDYILPTTVLIGWTFRIYTKQIWEWIMDDKVSAIGVWGMGGSGKTALATHIHDKLLEEANGDIQVIWVTVLQNIDIYKLQKVIGKSIKLDISNEPRKRIARKLFQAFKEMKKCVIILDDVWDHFSLKDVGFPMLDNRIKLILTTRIREVCQDMDCEKNRNKHEGENAVLRSSYDFLTNKLQRFFLYCVFNIAGPFWDEDADHLIRRFVYESIDETTELSVQYDEGYNMMHKLKNHSMLDYDDNNYYWMTHKFLAVLATGIVEDTGKIMGKACKNLTEIPSDDQWKEDLQQVFLMGNKIQTIPNGISPKCTQLSTLLLNDNVKLNHITDEFFNNMPALKTLDLSKTAIQRLPESVSNLKCLIALLLSGCRQLRYIPSLGKLKRLISLDLSCTAIAEAPAGLESLVNLRCLNLLEVDKLVISPSLISKLINLKCLELGWAQCLTDATAQSVQGLEKLEVICAYFHDISIFNTFMSCRFCFSSQPVGRLHLWEMNNLKDLVSPSACFLHQSTLFAHLTHLRIWKCNSIKTLMPFRLLALLQNLRTICVERCEQMKKIVGEDHSVMELTASGDLVALP
ncbi:disease resistance protein RFL1-like [Neltuma alba]|uniref:disease resistance protein RFL1-like n=1 Tax=Neltuma alba TaxID=207710 RepID=UPI0010A57360|nr:disease resistance protein RFL1-like [Prosopis alba]